MCAYIVKEGNSSPLRPIRTRILKSHHCMIWTWNKAMFNIEDQSIHLCKEHRQRHFLSSASKEWVIQVTVSVVFESGLGLTYLNSEIENLFVAFTYFLFIKCLKICVDSFHRSDFVWKPWILSSRPIAYGRGRESIYYHRPRELCIIVSGPQI